MKSDLFPDAVLGVEELHRHFAQEIVEIDRALLALLTGLGPPSTHYGMLSYHFGFVDAGLQALPEGGYLPRGKRLRPVICNLLCGAFGLPRRVAKQLMMAAEVMHSASLAHDDIQDRDDLRWNRPTLHAVFGLEQAINAGDALIGMVYRLLLGLTAQGVAPSLALDVIAAFNRAHLLMCEGQHLDLSFRYDSIAGADEYLEMVERKTAAACVCIGESIAILASAPPQAREALVEFGRSFGVLYQVCDDVRGIWSLPDSLGREIGHDVLLQRPTLPLLFASQHGSARLRAMLLRASGRATPLSVFELKSFRTELTNCGAGQYCLDAAVLHHRSAHAALTSMGRECAGIDALRGMVDACLSSVEALLLHAPIEFPAASTRPSSGPGYSQVAPEHDPASMEK
ncbi:polyprenyl synthetase family protein [Thermomonas carbonis]|uniref:Polyprenyl synthetase family protein n=1 Tax=Thermomonas carbonis TaxID=1463158 RepID=A0A7G9SMP5_9GAMM|nr:polyprenyl synthetase family protein [Thermomonas carbonis]QNN69120.1 polyprenyl synthetase family protein [Thermomonas carbonis]GHC06606.1 polyprenyl synthetase [Thermomonas carbonis]